MTGFSGFGDDFFAFFTELKADNSRDWFDSNRDRYRSVVQGTLSDFVTALQPQLEAISPHIKCDPRPQGGSIFRIHRDVRFSKDKRPYKEHAACNFRTIATDDVHGPGFYLHLAPEEAFAGGGIWMPAPKDLSAIRQRIAAKGKEWQAVLDDPGIRDTFGGVSGDGLSRPPRGYNIDHRHIADLKRKSFFAMAPLTRAQLARPDVVATVAGLYRAAVPLMRFLAASTGSRF